jgi:hypothetical protein
MTNPTRLSGYARVYAALIFASVALDAGWGARDRLAPFSFAQPLKSNVSTTMNVTGRKRLGTQYRMSISCGRK